MNLMAKILYMLLYPIGFLRFCLEVNRDKGMGSCERRGKC